MADITYTVEVALGGTLTDVTSLVDGFRCASGRQREFQSFPPGSASFAIEDRTGDYIPEAGGTWSTEKWIGRDVRLSASVSGKTSVVWFGQVADVDVAVDGFFGAGVTVLAEEPQAKLGRSIIDGSTSFSSELSSVRVENVLALSEVTSPSATDVGAGAATLQSESDAGGNALQYLQTVEQSEVGRLFIRNMGEQPGGVLTFRGRNVGGERRGAKFVDSDPTTFDVVDGGTAATSTFDATWDGGTAADSPTAALDGGDAGNVYEVPLSRAQFLFGSETLFNRVTYTSDGGTAQTAENVLSRNRYGVRAVSRSGLLLTSDSETLNAAEQRLSLAREPSLQVDQLELQVETMTDAQAAVALATTVGDRVQVSVSPPGYLSNGTLDEVALVESVTHRVSVSSHTLTLRLGPDVADAAVYDTARYDEPDAIYGL